MTNKHLQRLINEAEKLKETKISTKTTPSKTPIFATTPPHDEVWRVYKAICSRSPSFIFFVPCLFLPIAFIFHQGSNLLFKHIGLYYALFCIVLPLSNYIGLKINLFAKFRHFRKWRSRLPFILEGWEHWVDGENFHKKTYWRSNATIKVIYTPNEHINQESLQAILYLFCQKANRLYYFTDDKYYAEKWKNTGEEAKGSINSMVVYAFYHFIQTEIAPLVREVGGISKIILEAETAESEIDFPSTD